MLWIPRNFEVLVTQAAASRPCVVLTGARQVGKSALLQRLFPNHGYVSLDLPSEAAAAEHAPEEFLARHPPPLLVDEVQYAPGLFRHLKRVIDAQRGARGLLILTGSQRFSLMRHVTESLAGRAAILELEPLDHGEIRAGAPDSTALERVVRGGYPELWAEPSLNARSFYASYVATYLERDLRAMLRVGSLRDFERFLRACALRSGQLLNKSDLARDVGISSPTANEWLSVLDASGIVGLLDPWFGNGTKRLVKAPKLYLRDTGLLCFLLNLRDAEELGASPLRGAVFETAAYAALRKRLGRTDELASLSFYRDRAIEVDFVLHRGGRALLFECKWTEQPSRSDFAAMRRLAAELGDDRVAAAQLVCRTPQAHPTPDGWAVPLDGLRLD